MTASERYEMTWKSFLVRLNVHPTMQFKEFLEEKHVNRVGMEKWLYKNGLSVREAKKRIWACHQSARKDLMPPDAVSTGCMFLPVESPAPDSPPETDLLTGISITFPDGTQVGVRRGSPKAVMSFLKLYTMEGGAPC